MMPPVQYVQERDVAYLTLSRSERGNALASDMVGALDAALDQATADRSRLIVLRGAGKHFCTGFDLGELPNQSDADLAARFIQIELLLQKIAGASTLTACVAHGRTVGAGADLFAACDVRLCSPDASFAFPGAGFGIVLGTGRLAARVGADATNDLVLSGRTIPATEAKNIGLASDVIPADEVSNALEGLRSKASRLDAETTVAILSELRHLDYGDRDLAALVRSVMRPDLQNRITNYKDRLRR